MRHAFFGLLFCTMILYCKPEDLFRCVGVCVFLALVYIASEIADGNKLRAEEFKWKKTRAEKADAEKNKEPQPGPAIHS